MREELITAIVMLLILIGGSAVTRNDKKWSVFFLFLASVAGSLVSGMGIRFREIAEGPFGFLDSMLCVCAASVLVAAAERGGVLGLLFERTAKIKNRTLKAFAVLFLIALPAMLTGFASASILTTGKRVREALPDRKKAPVIIGVGAFLGVMFPPNCIPAMIAANGAGSVLPTPYSGFFLPLLILTLPAFIVFAITERAVLSSVSPVSNAAEISSEGCVYRKKSFWALIVLCITGLAVIIDGLFSSVLYPGGNTLVFFIASLIEIALSIDFRNSKLGSLKIALKTIYDGVMNAVVPMSFVFALGSFIEVSSMTGFRGLYSLWILPYSPKAVMLVLMVLALFAGYFLSVPIPALLAAYAVFPIGWLANTVVVAGCSVVIAVCGLVTRNGGISCELPCEFSEGAEIAASGKERLNMLKEARLPVILGLVMGILMVIFGDRLSFLIM